MYISKKWIMIAAVIALLGLGGTAYINNGGINAQENSATTSQGNVVEANNDDIQNEAVSSMTIPIQPASTVIDSVSAAGNIELVEEQVISLDVNGVVQQIHVKAGDQVQAGQALLSVDTTELTLAVRQAELSVQSQKNSLSQLYEEADAADLAQMNAALNEAQQNLNEVYAGPSEAEVSAAQNTLASAHASYNELLAGPTDAENAQLSAELRKAEVAVQETRREYDKIKWRNDIGMTAEAAALQDATIEYDRAMGAYQESVATADQSAVNSALSSIQDAQVQLDDLLNSPSATEIASAQAQVASAEANLATLTTGPSSSEVLAAQISLEQAELELQEAQQDLAAAQVVASINGTVLEVAAVVGEHMNAGAVAVTIADTTQLELTIDVAEVDIPQVAVGQAALVEIDALSSKTFQGVIDYIAPSSDDNAGVVNYPVTIRLTDDDLANILPGMTAVATVEDTESQAANSWMVPTSAIQATNDGFNVLVVDGESSVSIDVIPSTTQGEWTVVQSSALEAGDQVVGELASYLDGGEDEFGGPGQGGPFGG